MAPPAPEAQPPSEGAAPPPAAPGLPGAPHLSGALPPSGASHLSGAPPPSGASPVRRGIDRLLLDPGAFPRLFRKARRVGLVTSEGAHPPSARAALREAGAPLVRLFAPEHGLSGRGADGAPLADGADPLTGLPVVSLYGPRFRPEPASLGELDLLLFDLQDVGARFYTFLWTLSHCLEACAEARVPLWVLDRPNPLGGHAEAVEGPLPDPGVPESFLGRWPIPVRHSLTLGELARLLQAEMGLGTGLEVVEMEGWRRDHLWSDTGLPFHPPSPGIPAFESALFYPGTALLEATNVGEGRGTPLAFRRLEAPWLEGELLAEALSQEGAGAFRALPSPPSGLLLEAVDPGRLRPVALGLRILLLLRTLWPEGFAWAPYPTAANPAGADHLHHLLRNAEVVRALQGDPQDVDEERIGGWTRAPWWWERAGPHLLYS